MSKIKHTSYKTSAMNAAFISTVWATNPSTVVEIGTQQGYSAGMIGELMNSGTTLTTFDSFEDTYQGPPNSKTHANQTIANSYLRSRNLKCAWSVEKMDASEVAKLKRFTAPIDLLHIDICNHMSNIYPLLMQWIPKVRKTIILEGGHLNHWQKKYDYLSFEPILDYRFITDHFNSQIIIDGKYSITVLRRII